MKVLMFKNYFYTSHTSIRSFLSARMILKDLIHNKHSTRLPNTWVRKRRVRGQPVMEETSVNHVCTTNIPEWFTCRLISETENSTLYTSIISLIHEVKLFLLLICVVYTLLKVCNERRNSTERLSRGIKINLTWCISISQIE